MPKVVDHEARRREIADALWTVARRDGVQAVSVRSVAAEAGWSPSAIRHYFSTQAELLAFALDSASERIAARVAEVAQGLDPLDGVLAQLEQVLPLDAPRLTDTQVWLAMVSQLQSDPAVAPLAERSHVDLQRLMRSSLARLGESGYARTGLDLQLEADRLHALVDGLALHATMYPRHISRTRVRAALRAHLESLAR